MAVALTDELKAFLEEPRIAHFVTLMKSGAPQVTPVWVDHDGTHVLVNTAEGRQKPLNLARDNRVALSVANEKMPYIYVTIRGKVVDVTREGAWDHICKMNQKYNGNPDYPKREGEERIILKILPDKISGRGLQLS